MNSNYLPPARDSGAIIPRRATDAPGWYRAQQRVYAGGIPAGLGGIADIGVGGLLLVAGLIWLYSKAK